MVHRARLSARRRARGRGSWSLPAFRDGVSESERADIFVLPSIVTAGEEENQPVVLAEAQAAEIPWSRARSAASERARWRVGAARPVARSEALAVHSRSPPIRGGEHGERGPPVVEEHFDLARLNDN